MTVMIFFPSSIIISQPTTGVPAMGYGLRYKYGMFTQVIRNGYQVSPTASLFLFLFFSPFLFFFYFLFFHFHIFFHTYIFSTPFNHATILLVAFTSHLFQPPQSSTSSNNLDLSHPLTILNIIKAISNLFNNVKTY